MQESATILQRMQIWVCLSLFVCPLWALQRILKPQHTILIEIITCLIQKPLNLGAKNWTQTFFLKLFGRFRDIPAKSRDIPPKKFDSLGFEGHTELFGPHPFTWKSPTPPENIRLKSLGLGSFFVPENHVTVIAENAWELLRGIISCNSTLQEKQGSCDGNAN